MFWYMEFLKAVVKREGRMGASDLQALQQRAPPSIVAELLRREIVENFR